MRIYPHIFDMRAHLFAGCRAKMELHLRSQEFSELRDS